MTDVSRWSSAPQTRNRRPRARHRNVCALGVSNQVLGGVDLDAAATLIGRPWRGLRQNQDIATLGWTTASSFYDLGYRETYRSIQTSAVGGWALLAGGTYDSNLTSIANNLAALSTRWNGKHPALVCIHHEASISATTHTPAGNQGTPQDRINAFRHARDFWDAMEATTFSKTGEYLGGPIMLVDVGWDRMFVGANGVGAPTAGDDFDAFDPDRGSSPVSAGTHIARRIGSDVYNDLGTDGELKYGTDAAILLEPIRDKARAKGVDWMIGEFGCADGARHVDHVNKAKWMDSARRFIHGQGKAGPGVCRHLFATVKSSAELYTVDSSAESLAAWNRFARDPYFA